MLLALLPRPAADVEGLADFAEGEVEGVVNLEVFVVDLFEGWSDIVKVGAGEDDFAGRALGFGVVLAAALAVAPVLE